MGRRDSMRAGLTKTLVVSVYYHLCCDFESHLWRSVLDTTLCDKVCQWFAADRWFSLGTPVSSFNKTDLHDIAEILLKVTLNTITLTSCIVFPDVSFTTLNCTW